MQIGPLNLPDEVLTALEEKRLVIFAGAGVSIPPPANLPSFQCLVESIVGRALLPDEAGQMDRVLGRAKERGVPVHQLAAGNLSRAGSRFNALHENLVALFSSAAAVRIVTTNFDPHFEGAIEAHIGPSSVEVYTAPALPVGSSFTGLVHLHGALGRAPEELVLTDADFGRAYLTEGWAGRFVIELFREYTVLFVGYSYGDTVMSYLTRGLAPTFGRQRFALTEIGWREKWQLLGIQPIDYDPADDHRALGEGLRQWTSYERRGFLDWSQRLPTLVGREPRALAPDEQGELEFCLKNPKRARLFYQHANDQNWLEWAEERGRLQLLFSFEENQESLWDLAAWFTADPLGPRGKVALKIALKPIRTVGRALAILVSQQVQSALAKSKPIDKAKAQRAAAWAALLIERTAPGAPLSQLSFWLEHLSPQDHPQLMVQILAHLLRCQPVFHEGMSWERECSLDLSLVTPTLGEDLDHHWSRLREHIGALAWPLVPVITEIFEARWRWLVTLKGSTPISDPWTWDRSWVERPPGEDGLHDSVPGRGVGPLLNISKDVLDELLACAPEKSTAVIELWLASSAPQLVQLGLYGLATSSQWKPAEKLERLMATHLPTRMPFKIEVFRVLRESYPQMSQRQRQRFLKRVKLLYCQESEDLQGEPDCRTSDYEWFNVLVWLGRAASSDPLIQHAIAAVHRNHPEFLPKDYPELDVVQAKPEWVRPESILGSEEIAQLSLSQWLEQLKVSSERGQGRFGIDYLGGFLMETARAASAHFEWGISFTSSLIESGLFDHQVWPSILTAWAERVFKPGEWRKVLRVLDHTSLLAAQPRGVTEVVRGRVKQRDPQATESMLRSSIELAKKLLPMAQEIPFAMLSKNADWLGQAINHPGGQLAEFLILAIGKLLGPRPQRGCGLPQPSRRLLDAMVGGSDKASAMGRVVLASNAHYFLWIDPDWTRANLLPLFDWERDTLQAVQAWHGFLTWGRYGAALLEELTSSAVQLASHLEELGGERKNYGVFVARAAFSLPDDPLIKAWFNAFLETANDEDRALFAWQLDRLLEPLRPEQKVEIWGNWLNNYLKHRAQFPPPPAGKEIAALFAWSFNLPGQLAELVERLEALPGGGASVNRLLWKLEEGELAGSDPNLLARLVLALLKLCEAIEPWELSLLRTVIKRLKDEGAHNDLIHELTEKYLENGGLEYQELV